jgi:hypothetical protein
MSPATPRCATTRPKIASSRSGSVKTYECAGTRPLSGQGSQPIPGGPGLPAMLQPRRRPSGVAAEARARQQNLPGRLVRPPTDMTRVGRNARGGNTRRLRPRSRQPCPVQGRPSPEPARLRPGAQPTAEDVRASTGTRGALAFGRPATGSRTAVRAAHEDDAPTAHNAFGATAAQARAHPSPFIVPYRSKRGQESRAGLKPRLLVMRIAIAGGTGLPVPPPGGRCAAER